MSNILSTANSALNAAQQGLATTAHNISNAQTPGYSRQVILQAAVSGQDEGGGYIGKGTQVVSVRRVYDEYLGAQLRSVQTAQGQLESHLTQVTRIDNMLGDPTSGLSPVLQDFFQSVQNLAANPSAGSSMLSSAQSLSARFQSMDGQLRDLRTATNSQISTTITEINSYAKQIADLNDAISKAQGGNDGQQPNDLLDQRDYAVSQLSQLTKVAVTKDGPSYGVFIGNGQPLVVGRTVSQLVATTSPTDTSETMVGMVTSSGTVPLSDSSLPGGKLGGLLDFRATTLTNAQNELGRIALGLATTFNAQHELGQDKSGTMGIDFFNAAPPAVQSSTKNSGNAVVGASVVDVSQLKASDYQVKFDGTNYWVTRLSDNKSVNLSAGDPNFPGTPSPFPASTFPAQPVTIDGVSISVTSGGMNPGDTFIVKPTINAAAAFSVLVTDPNNIATSAPINTSAPNSNAGTGTISPGSVDANFTTAMVPATLTYVANVPATFPPSGTLNAGAGYPGSGFPFDVKVTLVDGTSTIYPAGTPVPYTSNSTITFGASLPSGDVGGISFQMTGAPVDGDTFNVNRNLNTVGDNRNMTLLGNLQTTNTLMNGTASYQDALASLVAEVGNKAHELDVSNTAQSNLVTQLQQAQDSGSGVNLDEEGANLLRYQQAYVAAGKVMQAVKEMFDLISQMGG